MEVVTLAQRPDLAVAMREMPNDWPAFMMEDPVAEVLFGRLTETFADYQLLALDDAGEVVGKLHSIPFGWDGTDADLPDRGWDAVLSRGFTEHRRGVTATAVSLLEARLAGDHLGRGNSRLLLEAGAANARRFGLADMFGPVRPTAKHLEPRTPMSVYASRIRADGLPADPWLRVHVRMGARIVKVCTASMSVPGSLALWRSWTGLPFDVSGELEVPFALVPVHVSVEHDHAVYVEPNVWVHHRLEAP